MNNSEDQLLWTLLIKGNMDAFEKIYRNHIRDLYDFGMRMVADNEIVQDSIQDLFLNLHIHRDKLGEVTNVKNYLLVRLRNLLIDRYRSNSKLVLVEDWSPYETGYAQWRDSLEIQDEEKEKKWKLKKQLDLLTLNQQRVIYYRFVKGLSIKEIAAQLNINTQSASNIIQRALKKMKATMILIIVLLLQN